jgi:dCMP deaminase
MASQAELDRVFMEIVGSVSSLSKCNRAKVGSVIVRDGRVISIGYNGTPVGFNNRCEGSDGKTKSFVVHAEANAIFHLARSNNTSEGATMYCTLSPCQTCAISIIQSGIRSVIFSEYYSDTTGLDLLSAAGVEHRQYKPA